MYAASSSSAAGSPLRPLARQSFKRSRAVSELQVHSGLMLRFMEMAPVVITVDVADAALCRAVSVFHGDAPAGCRRDFFARAFALFCANRT